MNKKEYIYSSFLYKYIYFVYTIYSREWECNIPFLEVYIPYYDLFNSISILFRIEENLITMMDKWCNRD